MCFWPNGGGRGLAAPVKDADHSDDEGVGEERWLTPAEAEEYQRLQGEGFPDWTQAPAVICVG